MPQTPEGEKRGRGRPRLGDGRIECVVPQAVIEALKARENQSGIYRTRIAAEILTQELIGEVVSRS